MKCVTLDLDPASPPDEIETLYHALLHADDERQMAYRHSERFVPRLSHSTMADKLGARGGDELPLDGTPFRLDTSGRGILDNLEFRPLTRREPEANEVEVEVYATGSGLPRAVLNALDMYPGSAKFIGSECAGKIVAVGKEVEGFAAGDEVIRNGSRQL